MKAVIFDMDGTIVDNNRFHLDAWKIFFRNQGMAMPDIEQYYGKPIIAIMESIFPDATKKQIRDYSIEKEEIYRKIYKNIIPMPGLVTLLEKLNGTPKAIATSSPPENVAFVMDSTGLAKYFDVIIDETAVRVGKPDPGIYLETAKRLGVDPRDCLVFEDSSNGIRSALSAGMAVISIKNRIKGPLKVIDDFTGLNVDELLSLRQKTL